MQYYTEEELLEVLDILMEDYDLSETEAFNILSEIKVSDETVDKLVKRNIERNRKAEEEYDRTGDKSILDKRMKVFEKNMDRLNRKVDENFNDRMKTAEEKRKGERKRDRYNNELDAARKRKEIRQRVKRNRAIAVGGAAALAGTAIIVHKAYKKHQAKKALKENSILMRENAKSITRK